MRKRRPSITESEIINRFKKVHGDNYDYSHLNYKSTNQKVNIICKKCGYKFSTLPHNHTNGGGCKPCQYKKLPQNQPMSNDKWVKLATKFHKNQYE